MNSCWIITSPAAGFCFWWVSFGACLKSTVLYEIKSYFRCFLLFPPKFHMASELDWPLWGCVESNYVNILKWWFLEMGEPKAATVLTVFKMTKKLHDFGATPHLKKSLPCWWFGTCFIFPYIGNVIIPTDELIFFRGVGSTTNQLPLDALPRPSHEPRNWYHLRSWAVHEWMPFVLSVPWVVSEVARKWDNGAVAAKRLSVDSIGHSIFLVKTINYWGVNP